VVWASIKLAQALTLFNCYRVASLNLSRGNEYTEIIFFQSLHPDTGIVQTLSDIRSGYELEGPAQVKVFRKVGTECEYSQLCVYVYIKGSPAEIQTPTHWNLTGRSITAPPPVLSPSRILRPSSFPCSFIPIQEKIRRATQKYYFNSVYLFKNGLS
jgi:hypothetical protein